MRWFWNLHNVTSSVGLPKGVETSGWFILRQRFLSMNTFQRKLEWTGSTQDLLNQSGELGPNNENGNKLR